MLLNATLGTIIKTGTLLCLVACAQQPKNVQLANAPIPSSADMTFVDATGCSWWVIGNATSLSWAPMTDSNGAPVCDEGRTRIASPTSQIPTPVPVSATPIEDAIPMTALASEPEVLPVTPDPVSGSRFIVQVASFAEASNAKASIALFESMGFPTSAPPQGGDTNLYRLMLGPFASTAEAQRALSRAKAEGFGDAFIAN